MNCRMAEHVPFFTTGLKQTRYIVPGRQHHNTDDHQKSCHHDCTLHPLIQLPTDQCFNQDDKDSSTIQYRNRQ